MLLALKQTVKITREGVFILRITLDVAFLPTERLKQHDCRVVVDLLRASTQIATFFDTGGTELVPAMEVQEAFSLKEALGSDWKLMGERGGITVPGFDYGNSPIELNGRGAPERAVITTSNGTAALLLAASGCEKVLVGCARNAEAVAWDAVCSGTFIGVTVSGRNGEFSMEDIVCAGMLVEKMLTLAPQNNASEMELTDGAIAAMALWHHFDRDLTAVCMESEHGRILRKLGFTDDILFCCETDSSAAVPRLISLGGRVSIIAG